MDGFEMPWGICRNSDSINLSVIAFAFLITIDHTQLIRWSYFNWVQVLQSQSQNLHSMCSNFKEKPTGNKSPRLQKLVQYLHVHVVCIRIFYFGLHQLAIWCQRMCNLRYLHIARRIPLKIFCLWPLAMQIWHSIQDRDRLHLRPKIKHQNKLLISREKKI